MLCTSSWLTLSSYRCQQHVMQLLSSAAGASCYWLLLSLFAYHDVYGTCILFRGYRVSEFLSAVGETIYGRGDVLETAFCAWDGRQQTADKRRNVSDELWNLKAAQRRFTSLGDLGHSKFRIQPKKSLPTQPCPILYELLPKLRNFFEQPSSSNKSSDPLRRFCNCQTFVAD